MKLHYSQTVVFAVTWDFMFDNHMKLHYSQTCIFAETFRKLFDNHMKLHYSQTSGLLLWMVY